MGVLVSVITNILKERKIMARPYTDISKVISSNPIKNGTVVGGTTFTGKSYYYNAYVNNNPTINDIEQKYGNRFYNGIFVYNLNTLSEIDGGNSI